MSFLFTSESVSEGHPDKVADQISDALLDEFLRFDPNSRVACETLVTTGLVVCAGEVTTEGYVDLQRVVRDTIKKIGYTKAEYRFDGDSCAVLNVLHEQSPDINRGVDRKEKAEQGAGDQGMMFGYANSDLDNYAPLPIELAHRLLQSLADIRKAGKKMKYLRPDSKSQVTVEYDDNGKPLKVNTIVISTQHDPPAHKLSDTPAQRAAADKKHLEQIKKDVKEILVPMVVKELPAHIRKLFKSDIIYHVNPTGKFEIGGPHGDSGLTGRKIIVDTYGGKGAHGGGAFSGKDASKVDRSAAYAMRYIAKNLVAAGVADEVLVQVAYAIGVAKPVGLYVNTFGTCHVKDAKGNVLHDGEIAEKIAHIFPVKPYDITEHFGLTNPIFEATATYGHFGRDVRTDAVPVYYPVKGAKKLIHNGREAWMKKVEFFGWEKTDKVEAVKKAFKLK